MKATPFAASITAIALLFAAPISAQQVQNPGKACKEDRQKFCSDLKPGDGKMGACMKEHAAELSAGCTAALKAVRDSSQAVRASCKADKEKFCATVEKGHGGLLKCLESHESELSAGCAEAVKSRSALKKS